MLGAEQMCKKYIFTLSFYVCQEYTHILKLRIYLQQTQWHVAVWFLPLTFGQQAPLPLHNEISISWLALPR
jgi:hypothetical protein